MLCLILIVGGLLIVMGQHSHSEALFYCFRLEDQVPEHHLLRLIDKHISFEFVRRQLKDSYSETGRPEVGGGTAHASGVALVHRARLRSRDPASLDVLQEPAPTVSGVEAV
jgi:hypothetical protein